MKQEIRLLKQEIDLQPKEKRKEEFRQRRAAMEVQHEDKERSFLSSLSENHDIALRRLSEKHRDRLATIDKNYLQQKQTVSVVSIYLYSFLTNIVFIALIGHENPRSNALGTRRKTNSRKTSIV